MLKIENLTKSYKKKNVVDGIELSIEEGEVIGILGPNGAGKSTLLSMIATLLKPSSGDILFEGKSVLKEWKQYRRIVGYVPQDIALYKNLSIMENLRFWGKAYGIKKDELIERIREVSMYLRLGEFLAMPIDKCSGGIQRRVNIGVALLHSPRLLIMDEPTVGIDPLTRHQILNAMTILNQENKVTIIYTSHYLEEIKQLCTRLCFMDHGKVKYQGTMNELEREMKQSVKQKKNRDKEITIEAFLLSKMYPDMN